MFYREELADSIGVSVDELSRLKSGSLEVKSDLNLSVEEQLLEKLLNETGKQLTNFNRIRYWIVEYSKNILNQVFGDSG